MRANEVSIVVCANCGHDHPLATCLYQSTLSRGLGGWAEEGVCGCTKWQPILKPFAAITSTRPKGEHWGWKVLAWAALIGLFAYALVSKGGM